MAVGIIIGAAFGTIVKSLVSDVLMPPLGMLVGNVDFSELFIVLKSGSKFAGPYTNLKEASAAGAVTLNYGLFINSVVPHNFLKINKWINFLASENETENSFFNNTSDYNFF